MANPLTKDELLKQLAPFGQQDALRFWDELSPEEQSNLAGQLGEIDFEALGRLYRAEQQDEDWPALAARAVAPPAIRLKSSSLTLRASVNNPIGTDEAQERRARALAEGKVATIIVAGGQATRLGFKDPKGMYRIGPVSQATLFQILFEKILAVSRRYEKPVPVAVMTSPATHAKTIEFLNGHGRFGIAAEDVHVFCQGTMPALDAGTGQVLLEGKDRLCLSPDGHGGTLAALAHSGVLGKLQAQGIEQIFYFQVDNPLVRVCDPEMLGYHLLSRSEVSTKVIAKRSPKDKLGNVVSVDGRVRIIEYSDLSDEAAERRNPDGSLSLWAGNIAVHVFDLAFLASLAGAGRALPFHRALKKVPHIDSAGRLVTPEKPNAVKFERFIFDTLPAAARSIVVETDPDEEFAAVKNEPGSGIESPEWVQAKMISQHTRWLASHGVTVAPGVPVEISPLFALDAPELQAKIPPDTRVEKATYFH